MSIYSNPAITFSKDTESTYYTQKEPERQDRYIHSNSSQYPQRRSGGVNIGDEDEGFVTLMKIRQAISAATMDHTQRRSVASDYSVNRSRPSSRSRTHNRPSSTERRTTDLPEITMLGSDLHNLHVSTYSSRRRSRSTGSNDSITSDTSSVYSTTSTLPVPEFSTVQRAENSSIWHTQSTDRYMSRRNKPYASYHVKSTSSYSDYELGSQSGSWNSPPSFETVYPYHSRSGSSESSIYEETPQPKDRSQSSYTEDTGSDYFSHRSNRISRSWYSNRTSPDPNTDGTLELSRTPSLTSTQNSPPSTPSSYSDSSFITDARLLDYTIDEAQPAPPEPEHITQPAYTTDETSTTSHLSKPRRFFRTRTKPRSRTNPTTTNFLQPLSTSTATVDRHDLFSAPVSPLTPMLTLPTFHFPITADSHPVSTSIAVQPCSLYANTVFTAGLSFGIPAPELGIRLASLENMAERQEILTVRKGGASGLAW